MENPIQSRLARLVPVLRSAALAAVLGGAAVAAAVGMPELALESLPRPAVPPPEVGPVVPAQVLGWRQQASALEHGELGGERDPVRAAQLYCRAARYGDAEAQYSLAWMLTNERGIERNDAQAAHLFVAAAEQGHVQAANMARMLGTPRGEPPPCLRPPEEDQTAVAAAPAPRPAPPNAPPPIVNFVKLVAPDYRLEPNLVLAVMATESNFNPWAVSPRDARGLMQLIPATARRFKVRDIMDPAQNIRGGMAYLRWLLATFEGDVTLALAAYNAGEGAVERYRGVPPYAETRLYVARILDRLGGQRRHAFDPEAARPSSALPLMRQRGR